MKALAIPAEQWPLMAWNILLHAFARLRDGNQAYLTFWSVCIWQEIWGWRIN